MKPLMPAAGVVLGLFGLSLFITFATDYSVATDAAKRAARQAESDRQTQVIREQIEEESRIARAESKRKTAIILEAIATAAQ